MQQYIEQYEEQGYFVVDGMVDEGMVDELEGASRRVRDKVRSGEVDVANNRGDGDPTAIFGLLAPEFDEAVFARYLLLPKIVEMAKAFLGDELRLGYVHLWSCGEEREYDTGWHRDLGGEERDASEEEEMEILRRPKNGLKWHLPLVDDAGLWIVPQSHLRPRTAEERACLVDNRRAELSGQVNIALKRGQTVYWNGSTIHRGRIAVEGGERLTLTGGLRKYMADVPREAVDERFRWRLADNVRAWLPAEMHLWYDRWYSLQEV